MQVFFSDTVQPSENDLLIQVKISDELTPLVDGNPVNSIGLKHHNFLLPEFDDHGNMIIVTAGQNSLDLGPQVLSVEQKEISSFGNVYKLCLSHRVLTIIVLLGHRFEHELTLLLLIICHIFDPTFPLLILQLVGKLKNKVLALSIEA